MTGANGLRLQSVPLPADGSNHTAYRVFHLLHIDRVLTLVRKAVATPLLLLTAVPIFATGLQIKSADLTAIRGLVRQWDTAWNSHDAQAIALLLTDDADTVNRFGLYFHDRAETEVQLGGLLSGPFKEVQCAPQKIISVRLIRSDVAIVRTEWEAPEDVLNAARGPRAKMIVSYVMTRTKHKWMISAMDLHTIRGGVILMNRGSADND